MIRVAGLTLARGTAIGAFLLLAGLGWQASAPAATVPEALVRERAVAHAKEKLAALMSKDDLPYITVDVVRVPTVPLDFPEAEQVSDVKITTDSALETLYSDRAVVRIRFEGPKRYSPAGEKQTIRELGVPIRITVKKPVWVVKNAIDAKAPLSRGDLALETRDVSQGYGHVVGSERDLSQYAARVNLRPGEVLDARKIAIPPDVTCNSDVRILLSNGNGMMLTVPGVAMSDGRVGDVIRVRQALYQRKYYQAKIIDKNRVLVEI